MANQLRKSLSGNEAVATAMMQINPDVVAAFPITPSTEVPQYFSSFVANGMCDTEFVPVESEHSAMSACIGASAAGGRVMTATSANGLALMWEMLYIASGDRLPIVLAAVNRALSAPLNIHNDHSDTMGARDSGWVQIYGDSAQEAYDNFIQAVRIAEHPDVMTPVMDCYDGFITSHAVENLMMLEKADVQNFVGKNRIVENKLVGGERPISIGPLVLPNFYMEIKRQQLEGLKNAKRVVLEVAKEFEALTGRKYGLFEEYKLEDAEVAIVVINSTAGTTKTVVDGLRAKGVKAGLLKIRLYRPFPGEEIAEALKNVKAIAVLDKAESFSLNGGPLYADVVSAMYGRTDGKIVTNYTYGLGGRDVKTTDIEKVYEDLLKAVETGSYEKFNYLAVRE
jgi:pyruvate ferredoxin oxidoreductase, alpha subunit (EC 1.2.7.1)